MLYAEPQANQETLTVGNLWVCRRVCTTTDTKVFKDTMTNNISRRSLAKGAAWAAPAVVATAAVPAYAASAELCQNQTVIENAFTEVMTQGATAYFTEVSYGLSNGFAKSVYFNINNNTPYTLDLGATPLVLELDYVRANGDGRAPSGGPYRIASEWGTDTAHQQRQIETPRGTQTSKWHTVTMGTKKTVWPGGMFKHGTESELDFTFGTGSNLIAAGGLDVRVKVLQLPTVVPTLESIMEVHSMDLSTGCQALYQKKVVESVAFPIRMVNAKQDPNGTTVWNNDGKINTIRGGSFELQVGSEFWSSQTGNHLSSFWPPKYEDHFTYDGIF